jgi:hypothetical protein
MMSALNRAAVALAKGTMLIWVMAAMPAVAQGRSHPRNVNDCTFLQDPTKVRQCIESFQGSTQTPDTAPREQGPAMLAPPMTAPVTPTQPQQLAPPPRLAPR